MWPFGKSLQNVLHATKTIRVRGVLFTIKKIDTLAYLKGSKTLLQVYDTYKSNKPELVVDDSTERKIREHYSHVFIEGVVKPKLSLKETDGAICVDELFLDGELVDELYAHIISYTYGKKKVKQLASVGKS